MTILFENSCALLSAMLLYYIYFVGSGLRRLRMGQNNLEICLPKSNEVLNLVMDENSPIEEKEQALKNIFSFYQMLQENHLFKNKFFTCIVYMLMALFIVDKIGFRLRVRSY